MSDSPDVDAALRLLASARSALQRDGGSIERIVVDAPGVDPISWLGGRGGGDRRYWRGRDDGLVITSVGEAAGVHAPGLREGRATVRHFARSLPPGACAIGTCRFDCARSVAPEWSGFHQVSFSIPRLELRVEAGATTMAAYITARDRDRADLVLREMEDIALPEADPDDDFPAPPGGWPARPADEPIVDPSTRRTDKPGHIAWGRRVSKALCAFEAGWLEKVVLARRSTWALRRRLDPVDALASVAAAAPGCYHVLIEADDSGFVCASPERLVRLESGRVFTEALAGTSVGGDGAAAAFTPKDRLEHALVVEDVRARLQPLVDDFEMDDAPGELALRRRAHLRTMIAGTPRARRDAIDVLAALHPTPAVGGRPRKEALEFIADAEPFDRGLYAGVVGRIGRAPDGGLEAEFAVGIRSALITPWEVHLYAGAGIVPGSDPAAEWDEVEGKMSDLAHALGLP